METISVTITGEGVATLAVEDEQVDRFQPGNPADARRASLAAAEALVREHGEQYRIAVDDLGTKHAFILHPDGSRELDKSEPAEPAALAAPHLRPAPELVEDVDEEPANEAEPVEAIAELDPVDEEPEPEPEAAAPAAAEPMAQASTPATRREVRQSFLTQERPEEPAAQGWRGLASRFGIRVQPSEAERAERADTLAVSQHWAGPRTIAVVNGKGGVGKSMVTISLSAVFARHGGGPVLAWDNNQTRGTLGWSTEQAGHDASILDLLPQVDRLLGPGAQSADLAHYVHHQTRDRYDVLRSKPEVLATEQRFDGDTVDNIWTVAAKYYRLVFIDSGNDETDPMWLRAIERADQIVVPTIGEAKAAESAALLLEGLAARGGHHQNLADNAVVVVSQHKHDLPFAEVTKMADGFRPLAREVVTIPYDQALGAPVLNYDAMRPGTQRAWRTAGAAIAKGL